MGGKKRSREVSPDLVEPGSSKHQRVQAPTEKDKTQKPSNADSSSPHSAAKAAKIESLRKKKLERKAQRKAKQEARTQQAVAANNAAEESKKKLKSIKNSQVEAKAKDKSNESKSNFITLRQGVQYQDVVKGRGPVVQDRKKIRVAYTLRAKQRFGKILDSSTDFRFRLGRGEVIAGWDIGIQGMRQGGRRFLIVPPGAGYGSKNIGAGPGAILFFDVSVLDC